MVDYYLDLVATGSPGNRVLTTNLLSVGADLNVWTENSVQLFGGSGFTLGQCNTEAKRLIPNWNKTRYWTLLVDTSSDLGGSPHNCLRLWKPSTKEFDKFLPVNGKLNNKLVSVIARDARQNFTHGRYPHSPTRYFNDFMQHRQPFGPTSRRK